MTIEERQTTDWAAWSRQSVEMMVAKNAEWPRQFGLQDNPAYRWDLHSATLTLEGPLHKVEASICLIGTSSVSDDSFLWTWANEAIPKPHGEALKVVYDFGRANDLSLLTTARIPGGRPEATECLCIAARLQEALGTWIDQQGDVTMYFTILDMRSLSD